MDLTFFLILGLLVACCVIPMYFMGKKDSKKTDSPADDSSNKP